MYKRAPEIAAAGGGSVLMSGPPGAGQSMLASHFADILPEMTQSEALDYVAI
jgi:magnesium chelatase family protein